MSEQKAVQVDFVAQMAMDIVKQFGMIAYIQDGVDSGGHIKAKLMPVNEVVARAYALAEETVGLLKAMGRINVLEKINE